MKTIHFATFRSSGAAFELAMGGHRDEGAAPSSWKNLCGREGPYVHGTLVVESEITCSICKQKWRAGMRRVRAMFRDYRWEE